MTAAAIVIDDSDIQEGLQRLLDAAGDLAPVLKNIGEYEAEETKDRFRDQRDPDGHPGSPSTTLYKTTRKDRGSSRPDAQSLRNRLAARLSNVRRSGSNVVYARIHNEGGIIKPKNAAALVFSMEARRSRSKCPHAEAHVPRINEEDRRRSKRSSAIISRMRLAEQVVRNNGAQTPRHPGTMARYAWVGQKRAQGLQNGFKFEACRRMLPRYEILQAIRSGSVSSTNPCGCFDRPR